jgi:hypothetical protein
MSMLTEQCAKLRKAAKAYEDVAPYTAALMREAADTIAALRNRLTRTCHMVLKDDHEVYGEAFYVWWECDECGGVLPNPFGMPEIRYCPRCGRQVVG